MSNPGLGYRWGKQRCTYRWMAASWWQCDGHWRIMNTWGSVGRASCRSAQKDGLEKGGRALTEWPRPMKWEGGSLPDLSDFFWYASLPCILAWLQTGDIMPSWCRMFSGIQRPALGNCITSHFLHPMCSSNGAYCSHTCLAFLMSILAAGLGLFLELSSHHPWPIQL